MAQSRVSHADAMPAGHGPMSYDQDKLYTALASCSPRATRCVQMFRPCRLCSASVSMAFENRACKQPGGAHPVSRAPATGRAPYRIGWWQPARHVQEARTCRPSTLAMSSTMCRHSSDSGPTCARAHHAVLWASAYAPTHGTPAAAAKAAAVRARCIGRGAASLHHTHPPGAGEGGSRTPGTLAGQ